MSDGDPGHGRKDNGLVAADYAAIGPIDPAVGGRILETLAARGIAAYLAEGNHPSLVINVTSEQAAPSAIVFADREHLAAARIIVTIITGVAQPASAPGNLDVDSAFAGIVAGLHGDDVQNIPTWPQAEPWPRIEDSTPSARILRRRRTDRQPDDQEAPPPADDPPSLFDAIDHFGDDLPDELVEADDEEGYTPPPPPPLPPASPTVVLSVLAIIAGFAMFFWPGILPIGSSTALVLGFCAVVAGFIALVWRLKAEPDDTDPDDGARV